MIEKNNTAVAWNYTSTTFRIYHVFKQFAVSILLRKKDVEFIYMKRKKKKTFLRQDEQVRVKCLKHNSEV